MVQAVLTYVAVAAAAAWVGWSMLLPKPVRQALRTRISPPRAARASKTGCGCGGDCS